MENAPAPRRSTELRNFLVLAGYHRRFISGFAETFSSLHAATSGKKLLEWTQKLKGAYIKLKEQITEPPVLASPNFESPFIVSTDASSVAVEAVLAEKRIYSSKHAV